MKLLRTIRFDPSDTHVFDNAAPERDWAVSGAFAFSALAPDTITGPTRQAFANGFLGLPSLGRATFVTVANANDEIAADLTQALAVHFVAAYGAPSLEMARPAAEEEVAFTIDLCRDATPGTVLAVARDHDDNGQIIETFRTIPRPGNCGQSRVWDILEDTP